MSAFSRRATHQEIIVIVLLWLASTTLSVCCSTPGEYFVEHFVLTVGLYVAAGIATVRIWGSGLFLFDELLFALVLWAFVFYVQPLLDLSSGSITCYGVDVFSSCVPATVSAIIASLIFSSIALGGGGRRGGERFRRACRPLSPASEARIARVALAVWAISMLACIIYMYVNGYSLAYMFSLGSSGVADVDEMFSKLGFLWKFSYSAIAAFAYYFVFGKVKALKACMFAVMMLLFATNGGRATMLICLLSPVALHYYRSKKNPSAAALIACVAGLLAVFLALENLRFGIRSGDFARIPDFDFSDLYAPAETNFVIYKVYYAFIATVPSSIEFKLGAETVLYPFIMMIPRAVWPDKPDAPFREVILRSLNAGAVESGVAYPGMAEFYIDFGYFGCALFAIGLGFYIRCVSRLRKASTVSSHARVIASLLYPLIFSLVLRGYVASMVFTYLFLFLPTLAIAAVEVVVGSKMGGRSLEAVQTSRR